MVRDWGPCMADDGVVVVGDMNHVPGSLAHRTLLATGLRDGLQGWGVFAASWPAGGGWPNFPVFALDTVLVGQGRVGGVRQIRVPGADHIAMFMTIGVE